MGQSYGEHLCFRIFGGSHDATIRMTLSGFPKGVLVDPDALQSHMRRRAPGQNAWSTPRREADIPEFLAGLDADGRTNGEQIEVVIKNTDAHSVDYGFVYDTPRPGHADYPALIKYGPDVDLRGGGRFSGRLTSLLCVAGYLSETFLASKGIFIGAHILSLGGVRDKPFDPVKVGTKDFQKIAQSDFPTLQKAAAGKMISRIKEEAGEKDSLGGLIECAATGLPVGLGEHPYGSLEAAISQMIYSVPAVKGIWFGDIPDIWLGSQNNDGYRMVQGQVRFESNHAGGILGGMSTGMPLICTVAVKPTPSIGLPQHSVSLSGQKNVDLSVPGRHDPCILPRAVPVIESAMALALTDLLLEKDPTERL